MQKYCTNFIIKSRQITKQKSISVFFIITHWGIKLKGILWVFQKSFAKGWSDQKCMAFGWSDFRKWGNSKHSYFMKWIFYLYLKSIKLCDYEKSWLSFCVGKDSNVKAVWDEDEIVSYVLEIIIEKMCL